MKKIYNREYSLEDITSYNYDTYEKRLEGILSEDIFKDKDINQILYVMYNIHDGYKSLQNIRIMELSNINCIVDTKTKRFLTFNNKIEFEFHPKIGEIWINKGGYTVRMNRHLKVLNSWETGKITLIDTIILLTGIIMSLTMLIYLYI